MARKSKGTSKVDMVRDAIGKIGWSAGIEEYQKYIKDAYGVDMSKPHISQTKSNERKRQGVRGRRRRKPGRPPGVEAAPTTGNAKLSDILSFVSAVQDWQAKIGAKNVREVVKSVVGK
jgi:hypothetical protein